MRFIIAILFVLLLLTGLAVYFLMPELVSDLIQPNSQKNKAKENIPTQIQPGSPEGAVNAEILEKSYYTIGYNNGHRQPEWVSYRLTKPLMDQPGLSHNENFTEDLDIAGNYPIFPDYRRTRLGALQLVSPAEMGWSMIATRETFLSSNICPQDTSITNGVWQELTRQSQQWAIDKEALHIVSGPVFQGRTRSFGRNRISIPSHFYKVLLDFTPPKLQGVGFIIPNRATELSLRRFMVSIDSVEAFTGMNFFPGVPENIQTTLESSLTPRDWQIRKSEETR